MTFYKVFVKLYENVISKVTLNKYKCIVSFFDFKIKEAALIYFLYDKFTKDNF